MTRHSLVQAEAARPTAFKLAVAVLLPLWLAPPFMVNEPAMVDYPNHLAPSSVLAGDGTPLANANYVAA